MPVVPLRRVGNLPAEVTSFIGRRHELAEAKRILSRTRLLTLTGVGGVGKTRLALRVAADLHRAFRDGVWLVELASLEDPELLPQTVAAALDVSDQTARSPLDALSAHLEDKHVLLVLDNCEHLLDACAALADTLLRAAPELRILATSRQALGVDGEWTLAVPSLSVPDPQPNQPASTLRQYDAVNLFAERAAAVLPGFRIDDTNAVAVARLCHRLDGIPLAIELGAVRLRSLSVQQILDRLDDRFQLLTGGSRTALPRQRTLRALIDWSFDLCSPEEQALWARLSVFSGGFDLEAAEAVCADTEIPPEKIFHLVAGLVDKSVLVREEHGAHVRYRLLETIRQYGRERLAASGGEHELRRRHRDWYWRQVEQAERDWFSARQVEWYGWLEREYPNLRITLEFSLDREPDSRAGALIPAALGLYWLAWGRSGEGLHWLRRALQMYTEPSAARAKALWRAGELAFYRGALGKALALLREMEPLAERLGDPQTLAYLTHFRAMAALYQGDLAAATARYEEAVDRYRAVGDPGGAAVARAQSGLPASLAGDDDRVRALCAESLALSEAAGEQAVRSWVLWVLSRDACRRGDARQARKLAQRALELKRPFNDRTGAGLCLEALAWAAAAAGQGERAARLLGALHTAIWQAMDRSVARFRDQITLHSWTEAEARRLLGGRAFSAAFAEGARLALDQAVAYAQDEMVDFTAPPRPAPPGTATLTRREMQIAELVAQGLSNKEIAAKLVIAQRTAETHVEHILRKLGFTSRTQIAAWVAEHRAPPAE